MSDPYAVRKATNRYGALHNLSQSMSYAPRPRSRPGSPVKSGSNVDDELAKEASKGLLGKSTLRSGERFDAIKFDYVPATKVEMRRSKSQPGMKASLFHV